MQLDLTDFEDTWFEVAMGIGRNDRFNTRAIVTEIVKVPEPRAVSTVVIGLMLLSRTLRRLRGSSFTIC